MGLYDPWKEKTPQPGQTVDEAVEQFLEAKKQEDCREKTVSNYRYLLEAFAESLPVSYLIEHVEADDIREHLQRDNLSRTSRDTYYRQFRTFFRWCAREGLIQENPIADIERPGAPKTEKEFLTPERLEQLISTIEEDAKENEKWVQDGEVLWLIDVIRFAVHTGLRRGEICDLRWGAVDFDAGFLTVRNTDEFKTKTGNEDRIPLLPVARKILKHKAKERTTEDPDEHVFKGVYGDPLNGHYVSERFRYYRRQAGLPEGLSFHSLRHTTASTLSMQGVPPRIVQGMMRHSSIETTMVYSHLNPDTVRERVREGLSVLSGGDQVDCRPYHISVSHPKTSLFEDGDATPEPGPTRVKVKQLSGPVPEVVSSQTFKYE